MNVAPPHWFDRAACKGLMAGTVYEELCWEECSHCVREKKRIQTLGLVGAAIGDFMAGNND